MCEEGPQKIHLYIDGEMQPAEALLFESHLVSCDRCRKEYESLVAVVEAVRSSRPLYVAPDRLFEQSAQLIRGRRRRTAVLQGLMAASVLLAGALSLAFFRQQAVAQDEYAIFAAESHLRFERGALPLDVESHEPETVSNWLGARLPFHLRIPNYPEQSGQTKRYSLIGARLISYRDEDAAFLAYRMNSRPISLLVTSSARVTPVGGEVYRSGGLSFHTTSHKGVRMITWVDKGLAYSLVSHLDEVGAESCVVCHGRANERDKFAPLKSTH